jgi:transposase
MAGVAALLAATAAIRQRRFDATPLEGATMNIRYRVMLKDSERAQLVSMVLDGKTAVRKLKRAQILLAADAGSTDEQITKSVAVGTSTVYRTKQRFIEDGLERALNEAPRAGAERKFGASDDALLIAVVRSKPPSGYARWSLRLLVAEMARRTTHSISDETIRRRLNEFDLKPWQDPADDCTRELVDEQKADETQRSKSE